MEVADPESENVNVMQFSDESSSLPLQPWKVHKLGSDAHVCVCCFAVHHGGCNCFVGAPLQVELCVFW